MYDPRPNPDTPREPLPDLPWPDIFTELPDMPETVYIVGSGPAGRDYFDDIPASAYAIALNSAITLWRDWQVWLCADHRVCDTAWWCEVKPKPWTTRIFSARLANRIHTDPLFFPKIRPHFYYRYNPGLTGASWVEGQTLLIPGVLRSLTVAASALQLALYCGVKQVVLCGVDMMGQHHIDSQINPDPAYIGPWPWVRNFNKLIGTMREHGMTISSLSPTALSVPIIEA